MKYEIEIFSKRNISLENIDLRHKNFFEVLKSIPSPWGIEEGNYPRPDFGKSTTAYFNLNKVFKNGIKGWIMYAHPTLINEKYDKIFIDFNVKKVDYQYLVNNVLKLYLTSFYAYEAAVFNHEIINYDFTYRACYDLSTYFRFYPVFFWNAELCEKRANMSLSEFSDKISDVVEKVEFFGNGILVIVSSSVLDLEKSVEIDKKLKSIFGIRNLKL